jgi:hypothetical protein
MLMLFYKVGIKYDQTAMPTKEAPGQKQPLIYMSEMFS